MDPGSAGEPFSRETKLLRNAEGRWFDEHGPLDDPRIERAFDRWIDRAEDGRYCLKNSAGWAYVQIEGAPVFVLRAFLREGAAWLDLSGGRSEWLVLKTLRLGSDDVLYCNVCQERLAARFTRQAQYDLADAVREDAAGVYLFLGGEKLRPAVCADPLSWP